jgi:hypothetical protein
MEIPGQISAEIDKLGRDWGQMGAFRDILGYRMAFRGSIPSTRAGNVQLHISYNLLACSVVKLYN